MVYNINFLTSKSLNNNITFGYMRKGKPLGGLNWKTDKIYLMDCCGNGEKKEIDKDFIRRIERGEFIKKGSDDTTTEKPGNSVGLIQCEKVNQENEEQPVKAEKTARDDKPNNNGITNILKSPITSLKNAMKPKFEIDELMLNDDSTKITLAKLNRFNERHPGARSACIDELHNKNYETRKAYIFEELGGVTQLEETLLTNDSESGTKIVKLAETLDSKDQEEFASFLCKKFPELYLVDEFYELPERKIILADAFSLVERINPGKIDELNISDNIKADLKERISNRSKK